VANEGRRPLTAAVTSPRDNVGKPWNAQEQRGSIISVEERPAGADSADISFGNQPSTENSNTPNCRVFAADLSGVCTVKSSNPTSASTTPSST
jgi:hypothetical protein